MSTYQSKTTEKTLSSTTTCQNFKKPCWKKMQLSNLYHETSLKEPEKDYQRTSNRQ